MGLTESDVQSFIVKLWLEGTAEENQRYLSHGYVTHVSSGERRYVNGLEGITEFIAEHLEMTGVKLSMGWRITLRSKRQRSKRRRQE